MRTRYFMSKANRDAEWQKSGGKRSSTGLSLLHPMYITDYTAVTGITLTDADKGFGNTIYKTSFAKLYKLVEENQ